MLIKTEHISNSEYKIHTLDKRRFDKPRLLNGNVVSEYGLITTYAKTADGEFVIESSKIGYMETQNLCMPKISVTKADYYMSHLSDDLSSGTS